MVDMLCRLENTFPLLSVSKNCSRSSLHQEQVNNYIRRKKSLLLGYAIYYDDILSTVSLS